MGRINVKVAILFLVSCLFQASCYNGRFIFQPPGPGEAVKSLLAATAQGDLEKMKKHMPKQELAKMQAQAKNNPFAAIGENFNKAMFETAARELKSKGGLKSIDIDKEQINGDTAKIAFTIRFGNGETKSGEMQCVKEDGDWKMVGGAR